MVCVDVAWCALVCDWCVLVYVCVMVCLGVSWCVLVCLGVSWFGLGGCVCVCVWVCEVCVCVCCGVLVCAWCV